MGWTSLNVFLIITFLFLLLLLAFLISSSYYWYVVHQNPISGKISSNGALWLMAFSIIFAIVAFILLLYIIYLWIQTSSFFRIEQAKPITPVAVVQRPQIVVTTPTQYQYQQF
jgi:predicted membrane protein